MAEPVAAEQPSAAAAVRQERVSLARRVPCCRRSVIYLYHSFPALLADASDASDASDTVTGSEDLHVMPLVPGNHVRERADANRLAICRAAPEPGLRVEAMMRSISQRWPTTSLMLHLPRSWRYVASASERPRSRFAVSSICAAHA